MFLCSSLPSTCAASSAVIQKKKTYLSYSMEKHCVTNRHGGRDTSQNTLIVNFVCERDPAFQSYSKHTGTPAISMCQSISDERPLYTTEVPGKHFKQCTFHFVPAWGYLLQFNISSGHVQLILLCNVNVENDFEVVIYLTFMLRQRPFSIFSTSVYNYENTFSLLRFVKLCLTSQYG